MKFGFYRSLLVFGAVFGLSQAFAAPDATHIEYFDCWMEKGSALVPAEKARLKATDDSGICGCFKVRENGGFGWRGNDDPKQILKVYDLPKPHVMKCDDGSCLKGKALEQCMDNVRQTAFALSEFVDGHPLAGAVPLVFDEGWDMTPFGEYFNQRKERAREITCFLNVHGRPDLPNSADWNNSGIFHMKGLPKKLLPETIARFNDFSDARCLDGNELTGFAYNGYKENVRHVDDKGILQGEEIGYMNDPNYPSKQGDEWGQVAWTANYKNGMKEGTAVFYKSSVMDKAEKPYYFKHLEVPYKQGYVDGTVRMLSDRGFVMAEVSTKRGGLHGRTTVFNPFKKKNLAITYNANNLDGFVDFGDFGGVFKDGLPNGMITFWSVKDTCYEWLPGSSVCYTERLKKKQWGAYNMGMPKGTMECWNGKKGKVDMDCPDPIQDSLSRDPRQIAIRALEQVEKAKKEAKKAHDALAIAEEAVAIRKQDAAIADSNVIKAERAAVVADSLAKISEAAAKKAAEEKAKAEADSAKAAGVNAAAEAAAAPAAEDPKAAKNVKGKKGKAAKESKAASKAAKGKKAKK